MKRPIALLCVAFLVTVALFLAVHPHRALADPGVLYVAPGGSCGGATPCFGDLQAAVDAAASNDEIRVATGLYTRTTTRPQHDTTSAGLVTQTVYISKTVTLRGGYSSDFSAWDPDAHPTTLDAEGRGRGAYIVGDIEPTLQGLRITNGDAAGLGGYDYASPPAPIQDAGGGIYVMTATATLIDVRVYGNAARQGAGIFTAGSSGKVVNSVISDNHASNGGGGLFSFRGALDVEASHIISNTSGNLAGGVYLLYSAATLKGNTISHNATLNFGGGADVASCSPTFDANLISDNSAKKGGGIYLWYSHSLLVNNALIDNEASDTGGGLWVGGSGPRALQTTIAGNIGSDGSGVFVTDGESTHSTLVMTNTVISDQMVGVSVAATNTLILDGVLWHGTPLTVSAAGGAVLSLQHQVTGNPQFASDGYHITSASAAIDAGVPSGILTDIDGQPRFGVPDLGADEYVKSVYLPLVLSNQ